MTWCLEKKISTFVPIWLWFYFVLDLQLTLNFQTYLITCRSFSSKHVISEIVEPPRILRAFAWLQLQLFMDHSLKNHCKSAAHFIPSLSWGYLRPSLKKEVVPNTGLTKQWTIQTISPVIFWRWDTFDYYSGRVCAGSTEQWV